MELAIGSTEHYPGSIADVEILRQNSKFHEEASKRYVRHLDYDENGLPVHHEDDFWAILADRGYQGASDFVFYWRAAWCGGCIAESQFPVA